MDGVELGPWPLHRGDTGPRWADSPLRSIQLREAPGKTPEVRGAAEAIEKTIRDPDVSITADNQHRYLYRRGLGAGKFARAWLLVIILYTRDGERTEGVVKTAYFTSRISAEGKIEWTRWGS